MTTGRLLGIDHGLRRIGVAVSDESRLLARELAIIKRQSKAADFVHIQKIVTEQSISALVIGIPTNYDGSSAQADTVRKWVGALQAVIPLPVVLWDEQLSSEDARELARQRRRKPTEPIDDLAARVILQSYLDALRDGLAEPPDHNQGETS